MDAELDLFFKESKPAALPQVAIPNLPKLEDILPKEPEPTPVDPDAPKKLSRREKARAEAEPEDRLRRTLFVGNLPIAVCKDKKLQRALKKKFAAHGKLVSIRFRSIGFAKAMPRKVAYATQQFHEDRDSVNAYVVMESEEEAKLAASKENATVFEGKHIRVDVAAADRRNDTKKSVFIGNLSLNIKDEAVWDFFSTCGPITNVRIVRDKKTTLGKGFGYVSFADKAAIELALQLAGTDCGGRPIRIAKCMKEGFHKETKLYKEKKQQMKEATKVATTTGADVKPAKPFAQVETKKPFFKTEGKKPFKTASATGTQDLKSRKPTPIRKPTERTSKPFKARVGKQQSK